MKFLVDANVLSEPTRPRPAKRVVDWLREQERDLVVNPIILGEMQYGIQLLSAGARKRRLLEWFFSGIETMRVLDLDAVTATIWSELLARLKRRGAAMPIKDSLIAATALQYRLTVATRNVSDYRNAGVQLINPFED